MYVLAQPRDDWQRQRAEDKHFRAIKDKAGEKWAKTRRHGLPPIKEREFVFEVELGVGKKLGSVEKDEEGEGAGWFSGGDEAAKYVIIKVDYTGS